MADFTQKEKTDVVFYLGWSGKVLQETSQSFNSVVNDRLKNIPDDTINRSRLILKRLKQLDDRLDCAADRLSAAKVDDITLNKMELDQLRKERRIQIRELSNLLDIKILRSSSGGIMVSVTV